MRSERGKAVLRSILALAAASTLFGAPPAFAGAPVFLPQTLRIQAFSTRVQIEETVEAGEAIILRKAEYTPGGANCKPPENEAGCAWTPAQSKNNGGSEVELGDVDAEGGFEAEPSQLRHLHPATAYYARLTAIVPEGVNKGEVTTIVPFETIPVARPEVPHEQTEPNPPLPGPLMFNGFPTDATEADFNAKLETNGADSKYSFEYTTEPVVPGSWKPFTSGASGTVTAADDYEVLKPKLAGLAPETTYYARLKASNEKGEVIQTNFGVGGEETDSFTTPTAKPRTDVERASNVTATAARVGGTVYPHRSETKWRFEYAKSLLEPWALVPGAQAAGTISQADAESLPYGHGVTLATKLSGLSLATAYYVRLFAENAAGEAVVCGGPAGKESCEPVSSSSEFGLLHFETSGPPSATTFAVHSLQGESIELLGAVNPNSAPTSAEQTIALEGAPTGGTFTLTFRGQTTEPIGFDAPANAEPTSVEHALRALPSAPQVFVTGPAGGPYDIFLEGGVREPRIEADGSGLTPAGTVQVRTDYEGGEADAAHYRFRFVSARSFAEHGWAQAEESPELDAGSGASQKVVGSVLSAPVEGETYRYRILAKSDAPGSPLVEGSEQTLTVPSAPVAESPICANQLFRTGASAHLPDCRAYEQLTPVDKEGAQEPFRYGSGIGASAFPAENGERAAVEADAVSWGAGPTAGGSPYFFSRTADGWVMTAGSPQPETGLHQAFQSKRLYSSDLSELAFETGYETSEANKSEDIEYKLGPPGGPYTRVAAVPRVAQHGGEGWVAANPSLSKLVLQTVDHSLLGEATGTKSGSDLYEYTPADGLRQLNVRTAGGENAPIGSCGARMARGLTPGSGEASVGGAEDGAGFVDVSGPHSVSADGSRVFFVAVPGAVCTAPAHLYMRVNGAETIDIGPYRFIDANATGSEILLDGPSGMFAYDTETGTTQTQTAGEKASASELGLLGIHLDAEAGEPAQPFSTPRYTYTQARPDENENANQSAQVYRYDSVAHLLQCISCASSYDPHPLQPAYLTNADFDPPNGGTPLGHTFATANGDFVFFSTPSPLVPEDVDGDIPGEASQGAVVPYQCVYEGYVPPSTPPCDGQHIDSIGGGETSPSSDVYEWRAAGVDGCAQIQGCLALLTDGRGGYLNLLLGSADEGRDVLIYTHSRLLPQDNDTAGDVYDVRIDGGFPSAAPAPVECEASACSTPPAAPLDSTPSSFTFSASGSLVAPILPPPTEEHGKPRQVSTRLATALKQCRKRYARSRRRRARCEKHARGLYGATKSKARKP